MSKEFILHTDLGNKIRGSLFAPEKISNSPCLIFVHGFKGFKDWGFGPYIGEFFAKQGFFVITFNFSHNGVGGSLTDFAEPDKFAQNTVSLEISELNSIVKAYQTGFFGINPLQRLGIIGHSRGGAVSLLASSGIDGVNAVAVWASVAELDRYTDRQKKIWREKGYMEIINQRTKEVMRLNSTLLEDIECNKNSSLNIENAVKRLNRPLLIIHGEQDLAVPVEEGKQIFNWSDKTKSEMMIIPAAGHTFDIKHPFEGSNSKFESVLIKTNEFFSKNLNH